MSAPFSDTALNLGQGIVRVEALDAAKDNNPKEEAKRLVPSGLIPLTPGQEKKLASEHLSNTALKPEQICSVRADALDAGREKKPAQDLNKAIQSELVLLTQTQEKALVKEKVESRLKSLACSVQGARGVLVTLPLWTLL